MEWPSGSEHFPSDRRKSMSDHTTRQCVGCKIVKPTTEFRGLRTRCKACCYKQCQVWLKTPAGQASVRKHLRSDKCRARHRAYSKTPQQQAYWKILRSTEEHKAMMRQSVDKYRFANPDLIKARTAFSNAVRGGRIQKPLTCSQCRKKTTPHKLHGHHHKGYAKANWFNVIWLCVDCHGLVHRR